MENKLFRTLVGDLPAAVGRIVRVCGWVQTVRAHGKVIFFDLRDRSGIIQAVVIPKMADFDLAKDVRSEWVVSLVGTVNARPANMVNDKIATGGIELFVESMEILSKAETLPITIDTDGYDISEDKRLKYRYLDLRRERLHRNLVVRHKVISFMRQFLTGQGFVEVETPILTKSTPEGARDFLVPARLQPGNFYALPQSPQQYKQLLMVGGLERYFQVARCMRDEDPRADRQAEHTQLDVEMSFADEDEVLDLAEKMFVALVKDLFPEKKISQIPFPRLAWRESMEKYGNDKPDLRKDKNDPNELAFCFVTDFPMFEWLAGEKKWNAMHHPFTKPRTEDPEEIKACPEKILAYQYDMALNGFEIFSGSLRNTNMETFTAVFEVVGHTPEETKKQFSHYFEAFSYGVPPHGGMAPGIDRFLAVMLGEPNIREVMAFPKTGDNRDLMLAAPSEVSAEQLKELGISIIKK
ncbi:MAG: aspartate--tRNA ligase [Minisyncoccales bacterium]